MSIDGWLITRVTGLWAEAALLGTVVCGLGIAGAIPGLDRRRSVDLHEAWTISAVLASALHVLALGLSAHGDLSGFALVVPFVSREGGAAVAFGVFAFWGLFVVATSSVLRAKLGTRVWRMVHVLAWATTVFAAVHGLAAGTDATHPLVLALHVALVGLPFAWLGSRAVSAMHAAVSAA